MRFNFRSCSVYCSSIRYSSAFLYSMPFGRMVFSPRYSTHFFCNWPVDLFCAAAGFFILQYMVLIWRDCCGVFDFVGFTGIGSRIIDDHVEFTSRKNQLEGVFFLWERQRWVSNRIISSIILPLSHPPEFYHTPYHVLSD